MPVFLERHPCAARLADFFSGANHRERIAERRIPGPLSAGLATGPENRLAFLVFAAAPAPDGRCLRELAGRRLGWHLISCALAPRLRAATGAQQVRAKWRSKK